MRRSSIGIVTILVAIVTLGWLWSQHHHPGDLPPASSIPQSLEPTIDTQIIRKTPETERALEVLRARAADSYGFDAWRETVCNGIAVFYQPDADDEDVAWYWFDLQSNQLTEQATLGEIVQALSPYLEEFELFTPSYMIILWNTPEGRPLYSIGVVRSGGLIQIAFSPNRCSAIPDIVQIMIPAGPSPIDIDLPAAVEQIRQQKGN